MKLTKDNIAGFEVEPGKSERRVMDDDVPGFGLRIRATGARTWFISYRDRAGKSCAKMLGPVKKVPLTQARAQAKIDIAKVTLKGDPQEEKKQERDRAAQTFEPIAARFLARQKARLKPQSYAQVETHLTDHWSTFNRLSVHKIGRREIATRLGEIAEERGPIAANRARANLSAFFTWSMKEGIVDANPVIATNKPVDETSRERVLSDHELVEVWNACAGDDDYSRIVRLLILTLQRRDEVGSAPRGEVNIKERLWSIAGERTKNGLPNDIALSDTALEIFDSALNREGREERAAIFGDGKAGAGFSGWSKSKAALDKRIEKAAAERKPKEKKDKAARERWTLHDLRRTGATRMGDLGVEPHIVEAILNHVSGSKKGVAGIYNRSLYAAQKSQALDLWAAHIEAIVAGKPASNVVALKA
jgi:integrase